ncbi:MAG: OmpA/MotB family protein [Actinomycetota bacterium]
MSAFEDTDRAGARQRRRRGAEDSGSSWLTTYADAITLMMAFFIMLYAMSEIDAMKFTAFVQGLREPFGNETGDGLLPDRDGLDPEAVPVNPAEERPDGPDRPEADATTQRVAAEALERLDAGEQDQLVEQVRERLDARDQLDEIEAALDRALQEHGLERYVRKRREERGLVVSIASDDVLFATGSTRIDALGRQVIEVVADTLDGFPNPLMIEGHTDDVPLDREGYSNWNLSTDRAVAVLQRMIEEHGLPADRVGAVGYGEHHPLVPNDSAQGRAHNRRVDIVVLIEEAEL